MNIFIVSDYIIDYSCKHNKPITNLQLQKTLFFLERNHRYWYHKPLFYLPFIVEECGPRSVTHPVYCANGPLPLTPPKNYVKLDCSESEQEFINKVIDWCLSMTSREMVVKSLKDPCVSKYLAMLGAEIRDADFEESLQTIGPDVSI